MATHKKIGKVYLAGAGPGDAGLITVKLQKKLGEADVIITDRLVNPKIITVNARKDVLVWLAGKQGYNDESHVQEKINKLIIEHALEGKTVIRLKGGDVAFFSNVLDELIALHQNNIPFEIIPGITAASGASAYTGIPLTARGFAQGVQFMTYNPGSHHTIEKWKALSASDDTLVFYMATKNIASLIESLLPHSRLPEIPIAVIEQACTPHQRVHISTLENGIKDFKDETFSSPSLVIVGEVIKLHRDFNWYNISEPGTVFQKL